MEPTGQAALLSALCAPLVVGDGLTAADRALLEYAEKLTTAPATITTDDITRLRSAVRAIHDAGAIVAYFAFVNRMADGLGVELEGTRGGEIR